MQKQAGLSIDGLHMIDEKALIHVGDGAFLALRKAQALPIACARNLSPPPDPPNRPLGEAELKPRRYTRKPGSLILDYSPEVRRLYWRK